MDARSPPVKNAFPIYLAARRRHVSPLSRYSTCRCNRCPSGIPGWSKSSSASYLIPSFSITRRERTFPGTVNETTSANPSSANAYCITARAPSVASPRPQCARASRHPISTQGVKCAANCGTASPMNPINVPSPRSSAAHAPNPRSLKCASIRSTSASLSSRVSRAGKNSIPAASSLIRANGSRSSALHRRSSSRSVSSRFGSRFAIAVMSSPISRSIPCHRTAPAAHPELQLRACNSSLATLGW
jgi:hypothetical protein